MPSCHKRVVAHTYRINSNYSLLDSSTPYAGFNGYDVYINDTFDNVTQRRHSSNNAIYIDDERLSKDPNMCIIDSHQIRTREDMLTVIEIIQKYEEEFPSNWKRSAKAMLNEWMIHNMCSDLSYEKERSDDVDFNNADEHLYKIKVLSDLLCN